MRGMRALRWSGLLATACLAIAAQPANADDEPGTYVVNGCEADGRPAGSALPALIASLGLHESRCVRTATADTLEGFGPAAREAVPALIQVVSRTGREGEDDDWEDRKAAVRALGALGLAAWEAAPALGKALKQWEEDEDLAFEVLRALPRIRASPHALLAETGSGDPVIRLWFSAYGRESGDSYQFGEVVPLPANWSIGYASASPGAPELPDGIEARQLRVDGEEGVLLEQSRGLARGVALDHAEHDAAPTDTPPRTQLGTVSTALMSLTG